SGSGKTTLLRIVSGLEHAAEVTVEFDGEAWQTPGLRVPAHRRSVGYVFQDGRLFPHLDVERNLRFGMLGRGGADDGTWRGTPDRDGTQRGGEDGDGVRQTGDGVRQGATGDGVRIRFDDVVGALDLAPLLARRP